MGKVEFNQDSFGQQLIITGLARLVEAEGLTPHEAFDVLRLIQTNTFHALADLHKEYKTTNNNVTFVEKGNENDKMQTFAHNMFGNLEVLSRMEKSTFRRQMLQSIRIH